MVPPSAMIRHDSSSKSPVSEFRITSTPLPPVQARICSAKAFVRDEKIRSSGMPNWAFRKSRFSRVPAVA